MTMAHVTHRLRHVIKQLVGYTLDEVRNCEAVCELAGYGVSRACMWSGCWRPVPTRRA